MKTQPIHQAVIFHKEDRYCHSYQVLTGVSEQDLMLKMIAWVYNEFEEFFNNLNSSNALEFLNRDDDCEDTLSNKLWENKNLLEEENDGETFDFHFMDECLAKFDENGMIKDFEVA